MKKLFVLFILMAVLTVGIFADTASYEITGEGDNKILTFKLVDSETFAELLVTYDFSTNQVMTGYTKKYMIYSTTGKTLYNFKFDNKQGYNDRVATVPRNNQSLVVFTQDLTPMFEGTMKNSKLRVIVVHNGLGSWDDVTFDLTKLQKVYKEIGFM